MKEVSDNIKEERKFIYDIANSLDREMHGLIIKIGKCLGELKNLHKGEKE